jgi:hypothetical protein
MGLFHKSEGLSRTISIFSIKNYIFISKLKGKATPVIGHGGQWCCETWRLTHGGEVVSLTHRPLFTPPGRFLVLITVRG